MSRTARSHPLTRPPPDRWRLLANGDHRREERGAPRRHRRGRRGDEGDHGRGRRKRQPSEVGDLEVPHEQPDAADERDRSHRHARQRQLQAAAEDERHEIAVDGAEGHPRAQLHGALPDEVRHHAVDAERRHEQRRQAEERHDQRAETLELQRVEDDVVHRPHVFHHQRRIGLPDGAADGGDQLIGRQVRADDDVHRVHPHHGRRHIDLGRCRPVQAVVAHVADDADDLEAGRCRVALRRAEAPIGLRPGQYARAAASLITTAGVCIALLAVGLVQQPAGAERDPHRRKEVRCGHDEAHPLSERIRRPALDVDGGAAATADRRAAGSRTRRPSRRASAAARPSTAPAAGTPSLGHVSSGCAGAVSAG